MSYTTEDLIGANAHFDANNEAIVIYFRDLIDNDGNSFLPSQTLYFGVDGAEQFLAAYFAYLNYRCRQRPANFTNVPSPGNTQQVPTNTVNLIAEFDPTQAIVSQPLPLSQGVQQEIRYGITQTRFDFLFSVYLQNVIVFDAAQVV